MEYKHKTSLLINELTDIDQWDAIEHIQELAQHVAILQSNITQLEKDAARWNAATRNMELNDICVVVYDNFGDGRTVTGQEADQAIDTAMEASNAKAD